MKRALKFVVWAVGIFLLLVALAALAVKLFLPKEKVKAMIVDRAGSALHRQVRLDDLSVSLFSGLTLSHFEVSEVPDFSHGVFLTSDHFALRPQLLPLLSKKIYIDVVTLTKPEINIIRGKDGKTFNFSDLTASAPSSSPAPAAKAAPASNASSSTPSPFVFLVSKIAVEKGRVVFTDHLPAAASTTLENLNVTLRNVTMVGPMDVALSFEAETKGLKAKLDAKSTVSLVQGSATLDALTVTSGPMKLTAKGEIKKLTSSPQMDLQWELHDFDPQILAPMNVMPAGVKITGNIKGHGTVKGGTDGGAITATVDATSTDVRYGTATFHKQTGVALSVDITGHYRLPLLMDLSDIKLQLAQLQLSGPATYSGAGYKAKLESNDFPLEGITPMVSALSDISLKGPAQLSVNVKSAASGPDVQGVATLKNIAIAAKGATISGVQSKINFTASDTNGTFNATSVQHDYFSGSSLNLQWNLKDATDMAKMTGSANLNLGAGQIKNVQKLAGDNKIAKALLSPVAIMQKMPKAVQDAVKLPSFDPIDYKSIAGKYQFGKGSMTITAFDLTATLFTMGMTGTVGLLDPQPINTNAQVTLPNGLVSGTGPFTIKMAIKGTATAPDVQVDKADAGKQVLNAVKEKIQKNPQQLENLFKGLFKK